MSLFDWLTILVVEVLLVMYVMSNFSSTSEFMAQLLPF